MINLIRLLSIVSDVINAFEGVKPKCLKEDINIIRIDLVKNGSVVGTIRMEIRDKHIWNSIYDRILVNVCEPV